MTEKKLIDWETLWHLTIHDHKHRCNRCEYYDDCERYNRPSDCPIWASLEDAGCDHNWKPSRSSAFSHICTKCPAAIRGDGSIFDPIQTPDDLDVVTRPKDCGDPPDGEGLMSYRLKKEKK